ncbi:MAG: hypothetical protein Q9191_001221 [Dirinaria sp. TL-2023a]
MHLLTYASILLTASAAYVPLQPRVDPCVEEVEDTEMAELDGVTADGTAGIGAEFESPFFYFVSPNCNADNTNAAKKEVVAGRTGSNWFLSADTGAGFGKLHAEYILNGKNIKVGTGDGAKAGKAVTDDLISWQPWAGDGPNTVDVSNNKCNPWKIDGPSRKSKPQDLPWAPRITTSMPLEALYSLMKEQLAESDQRNILVGYPDRLNQLVIVTQLYFQSNTNGIDGSKVTDDVLGFCSLILSYAKAATNKLEPDQSPKLSLSFMPRTEFNTIYDQVKSKLPGDLFALSNSLACYKTSKSGRVVVDTAYCNGPASKPVPNDKFSTLSYINTLAKQPVTVNVKSWIQGMGNGSPSPDGLSKFDESIDGSIGGLGKQMEKMYNSQRSAPLFEFRDLDTIETSGIEGFMTKVDLAIQSLHKDFADPP